MTRALSVRAINELFPSSEATLTGDFEEGQLERLFEWQRYGPCEDVSIASIPLLFPAHLDQRGFWWFRSGKNEVKLLRSRLPLMDEERHVFVPK